MSHIQDAKKEALGSTEYRYTVVFESAEEGGYVVHIPALGIATEGETLEEARSMAHDAITGYIESLQKHGEPIPREEASSERLTVTVSDS
jgi:antitoxin HicB